MIPQTEQSAEPGPVAKLRGELTISFFGEAGARQATIYDPITHRYFELSKKSTALIQNWAMGDAAAILNAAKTMCEDVTETTLETLSRFLVLNGLIKHPGASQGFDLWHKQLSQAKSVSALFASILFFRWRLGSPDRALSALYLFLWPLLTLSFRYATGAAFLCAVWLLSNMPDQFNQHLQGLASLQGAPSLLIALGLVKLCHEMGHGLQAKRLGLTVPSGGIMFMLGLPLPFVELSSAWALGSKWDRLRVDAGGILAEMAIAAWALLAFCFWPDGTIRSILFAAATSSLFLTLVVNLNPLMRFDGYFLLSDALGIKNLQNRSLALMKWRLRELLFNLGDPVPEPWPRRKQRWLIIYAIALTLYRLTLYVGIAILAYTVLNKALGIAVFVLEIMFFVFMPIYREATVWRSRILDIVMKKRIIVTTLTFTALIALFIIPLPQTFIVPARLENGEKTEYFAPRSAVLREVRVAQDATVQDNAPLWEFDRPGQNFTRKALTSEIAALDGRIARLASDARTRNQAPVFQEERNRLLAELQSTEQLEDSLTLRAHKTGTLKFIAADYQGLRHETIALAAETRLGAIITQQALSVTAIIPASYLEQIPDEAHISFRQREVASVSEIPRRIALHTLEIQQSPLQQLPFPEAAARFGGAVKTDPNRPKQPQDSWFEARAEVVAATDTSVLMSVPGQLIISGARRSLASRMWSRITQVLVRQLGN